jgi:hypothetical protein
MRPETVIQLVEWMCTKEGTVSRADLVDLLGASDYFQADLLFIRNYKNLFFIRNYINRFFIRNNTNPGFSSGTRNRFFNRNYENYIWYWYGTVPYQRYHYSSFQHCSERSYKKVQVPLPYIVTPPFLFIQ